MKITMSVTFELKNRKGQNIVGLLSKPNTKILGTAILQHGYSGVMRQKHILAVEDVFLKHGFQVFNFDTTNSFGKSDGHIRDARLGLHAEDFEDVANRVQKQKRSTGKILISGHSMGGYSVTNYARNYNVDYIIPISPVISGKLLHEAYKKYQLEEYTKWQKEGVIYKESTSIPGAIKETPWDVMEEKLNHNSLKNATNMQSPILLITGEHDTLCPPEHVAQLYDAISYDNKKFEIIKSAPHTFKSEEHIEMLKEIIDNWLFKQLSYDGNY